MGRMPEGKMDSRPSRDDVQRAEVVMRVAELHLARFNKSRDIEWYVNISFWTVIVVAGGFLLENYPFQKLLISHCQGFYWGLGLVISFLIAHGHSAWLSKIQASQEFDKTAFFKCRDEALKLSGSLDAVGKIKEDEYKPRPFWVWAASAVTFVFLFTLLALVMLKPIESANQNCAQTTVTSQAKTAGK